MKPEKQITLLAVSLMILSGFFLLPRNQSWMAYRILPYWNDISYQKSRLDLEERKRSRYRGSYIYSRQIANFFHQKNQDSAIVLLPSTSYFNFHGIKYHVPEPAVFYYYTGLRTLWTNNRNVNDANWLVRVEGGKFIFDSITSAQQLADTLKSFKQFPPEL